MDTKDLFFTVVAIVLLYKSVMVNKRLNHLCGIVDELGVKVTAMELDMNKKIAALSEKIDEANERYVRQQLGIRKGQDFVQPIVIRSLADVVRLINTDNASVDSFGSDREYEDDNDEDDT